VETSPQPSPERRGRSISSPLEKTFSEEKILDFEGKGIFKEKEFFLN
jgi:hypothetical protein